MQDWIVGLLAIAGTVARPGPTPADGNFARDERDDQNGSNTMTDASNDVTTDQVLLLATDGSDQANAALAAGVRLVGVPSALLIVNVVPAADPSVLVGSGHAGPVMSLPEKQELLATRDEDARAVLDAAIGFLAPITSGALVETEVLAGDPGEEICRRAAEGGVAGIVLGTRGQGGLKRALLGSVSDHVVRNAPCPVITVNAN